VYALLELLFVYSVYDLYNNNNKLKIMEAVQNNVLLTANHRAGQHYMMTKLRPYGLT